MEAKELERSILTTYRKTIYRPFTKGITDYGLLKENDHICVCISGGKDSFIMAKCMQEIEKHGNIKIKCEYVVMNPGYDEESLNNINDNAQKLQIPIQIVNSNIFSAVKNANHKSPCYICAKMRRGCLYSIAKNLGCNKIALGHHYDDVIETTMMSLLYNGIYNTMLPILESENYEGMELIRPLYLVREDDIRKLVNHFNLTFMQYKCPLNIENSKRKEIKDIIQFLKKNNEFAEANIFKSADNVEIDHVRGFIKNKKHCEIKNFFDKKE